MLRATPEDCVPAGVHEAASLAAVEVETLVAAYLEAAEAAGQGIAADSSYLKLLATDTVHRLLDLVRRAAGRGAALRDPARHGIDLLDATEMFLQARRLGIYGGSSEVQRNIIATRVLGLPASGGKA
jgi:alkylation response protein AidB-like acyl-CoA dehydrogenase